MIKLIKSPVFFHTANLFIAFRQTSTVYVTCTAAALAVLRVAGLGAVHNSCHCSCCHCCSLLGLPLLFGLGALLVITVALAEVVKAKVLDLVAAAAGRGVRTILPLLVTLVLKAKELQLGLLLGFTLGGAEPDVTRGESFHFKSAADMEHTKT